MSSNGWVWRMIKIISNYLLNRRNKAELNRRNFERKELMADVRNTIVKQTTPYGENGDNSNASNASNVKSIEMPLKNNNIEFVNHINIRNGMAYKINSDTPYSGNCELNELPKINYFDSLNSKTWGNAPSFVNKMYTRSMANTYGCDKDNPQRCTCKGSFLHGVPDGIWTITRTWDCWDESLSEKETISYKKGKKYGAWAVTHKAKEKYMGGTFLSGSFKNDKLNGVFLCINSGVKIIEIEYKNGLMRGKCIYRYEANGQKEFECTMKDGFKHGICTKWHPTGQKKEECHYSNGSLNDLHTVWNQDGSIKSKHSYKEGKKHGIRHEYYENGRDKKIGYYLDGSKHGDWFEFYENGNDKKNGYYLNGKKDGLWYEYEDNNKEPRKIYYENGVRQLTRYPLINAVVTIAIFLAVFIYLFGQIYRSFIVL